jgi:hypothetical protein
VIYKGQRAPLRQAGGSHADCRVHRPPQSADQVGARSTSQRQLDLQKERPIMPRGGRDNKTYTTINEVRYRNDGNHLAIKATAVDDSVVEFKV